MKSEIKTPLRKQFEKETGAHPFADQQYIKWLEKKLENKLIKNENNR
jgi:hypothetical protein